MNWTMFGFAELITYSLLPITYYLKKPGSFEPGFLCNCNYSAAMVVYMKYL